MKYTITGKYTTGENYFESGLSSVQVGETLTQLEKSSEFDMSSIVITYSDQN